MKIEENIDVNLCDLRFDSGFLYMTPKAKTTSQKSR